jgi:predicted deacetylase
MHSGFDEEFDEDTKDEIRQLFDRWEFAMMDEADAISRVSTAEEELDGYNINPHNPPSWLQ